MKEIRYFYVPNAATVGELPEEEAKHAVKVLRLQSGDRMVLVDGEGGLFDAEVSVASGKHCLYNILETLPYEREWRGSISLAIAPTKMMDRIEWMAEKATEIGFDEIKRREEALTSRALEGLKEIQHVHVLGSEKAEEHCGILTFTIDGVHPHDVSAILDADGIAVRAGHHCAQPLMEYLGVSSTTRASLFFYNTEEEIDAFVESMKTVRRRMGYGE